MSIFGWGQQVDDTLNTPWMWCAYICSYATKWMKDPKCVAVGNIADIPEALSNVCY